MHIIYYMSIYEVHGNIHSVLSPYWSCFGAEIVYCEFDGYPMHSVQSLVDNLASLPQQTTKSDFLKKSYTLNQFKIIGVGK